RRVKERYPYSVVGADEKLVLSRYPANAERSGLSQRKNGTASVPYLAVQILPPRGQFLLWDLHLQKGGVTRDWLCQRHQVQGMVRQLGLIKEPILLVGDYNSTDQCDNYRLLTAHVLDVGRFAG